MLLLAHAVHAHAALVVPGLPFSPQTVKTRLGKMQAGWAAGQALLLSTQIQLFSSSVVGSYYYMPSYMVNYF